MINLYHRKDEIAIDLSNFNNIKSIIFTYKGVLHGESQLPDDWILMSNKNKVVCVSSKNSTPNVILKYRGIITIIGATVIDEYLNKHSVLVNVEDIDSWGVVSTDFDKNTQHWENLNSTHLSINASYTAIVKKNLNAVSGEFYFADGTPYEGDYHQHSDGQAMTESEHSKESIEIYTKLDNGKIYNPRKGVSQKKIDSFKNNHYRPSTNISIKTNIDEQPSSSGY